MTTRDTSLVLYSRPVPTPSTTSTLTTRPWGTSSSSLISASYFTQQTGTAIATELSYRILVELINRLLHSCRDFASRRVEDLKGYMENRAKERLQRQREAGPGDKDTNRHANGDGGGNIENEVRKSAVETGAFTCPLTGAEGATSSDAPRWMKARGNTPPQPPRWVRGVLDGVREGRMESRDFWMQSLAD